MSIAAIVKVTLFLFAGVSLLAALRMLLTGMRSRNAVNSQFFNVGRLEARRKVFRSMLSTVGLVVVALLFLIGAVVVPDDFLSALFLSEEEPSDSLVIESGTLEESSSVVAEVDGSFTEEPVVSEVISPTPTPVLTETPTPTPALDYIYVDSPIVGVYIRDLPDGDIIDVLEDRTRLSLSGESTTSNGINWILVITDDEREGWVAENFTTKFAPIVSEPTPEN